jgi:hypothetical protein
MRAGSDDVSSRRIEPVEKLSQRYRDIGTLFRRVACSAWRTDFGEVCSFLRLARMFLRGRSEERLLVIVASFFSPLLTPSLSPNYPLTCSLYCVYRLVRARLCPHL